MIFKSGKNKGEEEYKASLLPFRKTTKCAKRKKGGHLYVIYEFNVR
jgi:hypothetical protein